MTLSIASRVVSAFLAALPASLLHAQTPAPSMVDPALTVDTVVAGLSQPIGMVFLGADDFLVTEKSSGQVKRVQNGVVTGVVLDLAVNSNSERGLLGIEKHPRFPVDPSIYIFWTESSTGIDSNVVSQVPLLGNRVDRFVWDGSTLIYAQTINRTRAFQEDNNLITDPANPTNNPAPFQRGNHNGGILRFGPDGKLYVITGDAGRRGLTQNVNNGPIADDQFGGPIPDDAHATGQIVRLNANGTIPRDNPFYRYGALLAASATTPEQIQAAINIQKMYAIGVRNSIGMVFDPVRGGLWTAENGGRAYDEINYVEAGFNGGWVQTMGPIARVADYKAIEVAAGFGTSGPAGLQQLRFLPSSIADDPIAAKNRMTRFKGSNYRDPQFSWRNVVPPGGLGFIRGNGLGAQYSGNLIVGSAVAFAANRGHLYRFRLNGGRNHLQFTDPALFDKVADNLARNDFTTEQAELMWGQNFGVVTDIHTGPDGNLWLVGTSSGTVRKIRRI